MKPPEGNSDLFTCGDIHHASFYINHDTLWDSVPNCSQNDLFRDNVNLKVELREHHSFSKVGPRFILFINYSYL